MAPSNRLITRNANSGRFKGQREITISTTQLRTCFSEIFTRPRRDTGRQPGELWFTPLQLFRRGQPRGREIAPAY